MPHHSMLAPMAALSACVLASCASAPEPSKQTVIGAGCILVERADQETVKACPRRTPVNRNFLGQLAKSCRMQLKVRPDGTVAEARTLAGPQRLTTYCRESMYRWRFNVSAADGRSAVEEPVYILAAITFDRVNAPDGRPETSSIRTRLVFDTKELNAL